MRESLTEEAVKKRLCTSPLRLVANAPAASRFPRRQTGTLQRCELARVSNAHMSARLSNARLSCRIFRCYVVAVSATNDVEHETGLTLGDADVETAPTRPKPCCLLKAWMMMTLPTWW